MIAVDTNVLIYSLDVADPVKHTKARAAIRSLLASSASTIVPWQVAVEFLAKLRKWQAAGQLSEDEVAIRFDEFLAAWVIAIPTVKLFPIAMRLHNRYSISHWDSLLVAAYVEAGVTQLYSEDLQHGANYDGVEIVNPLA